MEQPQLYIDQIYHSQNLKIIIFAGIIATACLNVTGISITKNASALTRTVADVLRTICVWIIGIILSITLGQSNQDFLWENLQVVYVSGQFFAFLIICLEQQLDYNKSSKNILGNSQTASLDSVLFEFSSINHTNPLTDIFLPSDQIQKRCLLNGVKKSFGAKSSNYILSTKPSQIATKTNIVSANPFQPSQIVFQNSHQTYYSFFLKLISALQKVLQNFNDYNILKPQNITYLFLYQGKKISFDINSKLFSINNQELSLNKSSNFLQ
ncbi:nucleotide-sugar transporter, putative [Ichthyophthirius multifiliis]|uniref:Nucleotide-sugar transporter, putative n=1 Tax=Ichthyophthirius multifiliis TaxID=5932 RepID=G0R5I3_ICHMU|nr:nucleotide-sugar transporter, putative [Ichthyophthirius multifiliis]EGR27243.1 nucleotide-sugar transporter, putative [Ichthyophthirius multifiliis]|eukprot:XP_004024127.1 nucleotide-sugar transporter, putative [Ichthyophthirius multifiliis]